MHAPFFTKKEDSQKAVFLCWRRPTLPVRLQTSTFGAFGLNCRVRNGYGWTPDAIDTNLWYTIRDSNPGHPD